MNFFGALGQMGSLLPGYMQGRENAINANWNDRMRGTQLLNAEMANAFNDITFSQQVQMLLDQAQRSQWATQQAGMQQQINQQTFPGNMLYQTNMANNMWPWTSQAHQQQMTMQNLLMQMYQRMLQQPVAPQQPVIPQQPTNPQQPATANDPRANMQRNAGIR